MRDQSRLQSGSVQLTQQNLAGCLIQGTVHEDHRFGGGDFFCHIRSPLVIAEHAHTRIAAPVFFGPLRKKRPDAIIFAQRIPTSEDEASGRQSHAVIVLSE
jgi:hypothetical protein